MLTLSLICACAVARAAPVRFTAKADTRASVYLHSSNPVVFEIGKLGIPWRRVNDVTDSGHVLSWNVRKGRTYEVWDASDYARAQLNDAGQVLKRSFQASGDLVTALLKSVRVAQSQGTTTEQQVALARLEWALAAMIGARVDVRAGVNNKLWPEYNLPVTCSFSCSAKGATAKLLSLTKPDNWKQIGTTKNRGGTSTITVRIPPSAARYQGNRPIIAHYSVSYRGVRFHTLNAAEAQVVDAFDREASISTVSDTQIDLRISLKSLLPIRGVTTEPYLPDGWRATVSPKCFDVANSRTVTYRITRPKDEKRGLRIVGGTFRVGDFSTSKRLLSDHALELGESSAVTGFRLLRTTGQLPPVVTMLDTKCRQVPISGRMAFDVSPNFSPGSETYVTVSCLGSGAGSIALEYLAASGKVRSTPPATPEIGSAWKDVVFVLRDASFSGKLPDGADFALRCTGSMPWIAGVYISRFRSAGS